MKNERELKQFIEQNFDKILMAEGEFSGQFENNEKFVIKNIDTLETLDSELSRSRYDLLVVEIPYYFGINFIDRDSLINLLKNCRTSLLMISDLFFHELNLLKFPNMVFYRNFFSKKEGYFENFQGEKIENFDEYINKKRIESSYGMKIAKDLENKGYEVYYYGLPSHRYHKQARRIFRGYGNRIYVRGNIDKSQVIKSKNSELNVGISYLIGKDITSITVNWK